MYEDVVDIMKICKICINFQDPIWLNKGDGADEDQGSPPRQEWLDFDPGDDIV